MSFLGYSTGKKEIVLIMSYVPGSNLDVLIFGKDKVVGKVGSLVTVD